MNLTETAIIDDASHSKITQEGSTQARVCGNSQASSVIEKFRKENVLPRTRWLQEAPIKVKLLILIVSMASTFLFVFFVSLVSYSAHNGISWISSGTDVSDKHQQDQSQKGSGNQDGHLENKSAWPASAPELSSEVMLELPFTLKPSDYSSNALINYIQPTHIASIPPSMELVRSPIPSFIPSMKLSTLETPNQVPTSAQIMPVMQSHNPHSTDAPTSNTVVNLFISSNLPEGGNTSEFKRALSQMTNNADFFVHLGDFNQDKQCNEASYATFSHILSNYSEIPVFVIPGDNEWNDCPNPTEAWSHWRKWFLNFDENWSPYGLRVNRQLTNEENFSFVLKQILFVGFRIVGGNVTSDDEWKHVNRSNISWLKSQTFLFRDKFLFLIVFGHKGRNEENQEFFLALAEEVNKYGITALYIHETKNNFGIEKRKYGHVASIKASYLPLTKVIIDTENKDDPFILDYNR